MADLANALLSCDDWDPKLLASPLQEKFPKRNSLPEETPFEPALPLIVQVPDEDNKVDVYIDDTTTISVDVDDNADKGEAAVALAMHVVGRPLDPGDPIARNDLVLMTKLLAEAGLDEIKILLGWLLNTRTLRI